jgi:glycosyltransferase involved in cell wall biosynthesis
MQEELQHRIEADGLTELVSLLGFIPEDRLPAYYQAADAFLMPTRDLECFGLPVIEAMACGCLPLVMPDGGPAEVCRDYPQWIAMENSSGAFTDLVRRYLSGEIPGPDQPVAELARTRYSERAVRCSILRLVESVAGRDSRAG